MMMHGNKVSPQAQDLSNIILPAHIREMKYHCFCYCCFWFCFSQYTFISKVDQVSSTFSSALPLTILALTFHLHVTACLKFVVSGL